MAYFEDCAKEDKLPCCDFQLRLSLPRELIPRGFFFLSFFLFRLQRVGNCPLATSHWSNLQQWLRLRFQVGDGLQFWPIGNLSGSWDQCHVLDGVSANGYVYVGKVAMACFHPCAPTALQMLNSATEEHFFLKGDKLFHSFLSLFQSLSDFQPQHSGGILEINVMVTSFF